VGDLPGLHHATLRHLPLVVPLEDLLARHRPGLGRLHRDAHSRADVARTDRVDGDTRVALGPELVRQRAREADHAVLGGRVGGDKPVAAHPAQDRRDRDDTAAARPPARRASSATPSSESARSLSTSPAPSAANARAIARPMPPPAPVITTAWSLKLTGSVKLTRGVQPTAGVGHGATTGWTRRR